MLSIGYVEVIVALRSKALIAWEGACVVRLLNDKIGVAVFQILVVSVVQRHWILVVDIEVCRILVQIETARASRWEGYGCLNPGVILHV